MSSTAVPTRNPPVHQKYVPFPTSVEVPGVTKRMRLNRGLRKETPLQPWKRGDRFPERRKRGDAERGQLTGRASRARGHLSSRVTAAPLCLCRHRTNAKQKQRENADETARC